MFITVLQDWYLSSIHLSLWFWKYLKTKSPFKLSGPLLDDELLFQTKLEYESFLSPLNIDQASLFQANLHFITQLRFVKQQKV